MQEKNSSMCFVSTFDFQIEKEVLLTYLKMQNAMGGKIGINKKIWGAKG